MSKGIGRLYDLPRAALAHTPTPIERLGALSKHVGGAILFAKRDDCTGLAFGGNKARQLEFYYGKILAEGADTILITGAVQSNFVRVAAAAAAKFGLECHIQLEERVPKSDSAYRNSGNVLLNRLLGAVLYSYPGGEDEAGADRRLHEIAGELEEQGRRPYIIPLAPGHPPLGALGYVVAAQEILEQLASADYSIDEIVVASGSGNTHAGLLFGLRALGSPIPVLGICVRRDKDAQLPRVWARCEEIAQLLEVESSVEWGDIRLVDDFLAPGYGLLNDATSDAIRLAAQREALMLDPVYTGKGMAGCLQRAHELDASRSLLFIHTGGTPTIFAYGPQLVNEVVGAPRESAQA